ncbi:type II toxin-antitoxin system PemK/MazF family toxin [Candidatus Woesearchaeota archaeon]|nr:type II toxin-antitoxin system PemK/MazF family toxin [Candidatus Woesearchaeota archaeon]
MYKTGDIILAQVQFTDTFEVKTRPAAVLFGEYGNIVVAGITSNTEMEGIPLTRKEGAVKDSIIKINYIFTISDKMVKRHLFSLSQEKRKILISELVRRLSK